MSDADFIFILIGIAVVCGVNILNIVRTSHARQTVLEKTKHLHPIVKDVFITYRSGTRIGIKPVEVHFLPNSVVFFSGVAFGSLRLHMGYTQLYLKDAPGVMQVFEKRYFPITEIHQHNTDLVGKYTKWGRRTINFSLNNVLESPEAAQIKKCLQVVS